MNIVRTLGIFLALAALSFVLGFFVLARLIPGSPKPVMAATIPSAGQQPVEPRERVVVHRASAAPAAPPRRSTLLASNTAAVPRPGRAAGPGPSLDPAADAPAVTEPSGIQKPRRLGDSTTGDSGAASDDGSRTTINGDSGDEPKPPSTGAQAPSVQPKRRRANAARKPAARAAADIAGDSSDSKPSDAQDTPAMTPRHRRRIASDESSQSDNQDAPVKKATRKRRVSTDESNTGDSQDSPTRKTRSKRRIASVDSTASEAQDSSVRRSATRRSVVASNDSSSDGNADLPVRKTRRRHKIASTETSPSDSPDAPVKKPLRHRRVAAAIASTHRAATDTGDADGTARRSETDSEAATSGYYHVHLGSFHSRDAAYHEVQRAKGKGFTTQVVPITHNGRTLYRVQAGAFHERIRAEAVRQSLQDASLDASVTQQHR